MKNIINIINETILKYLNENNISNNKIIAYHGTDNKFNVFDDSKVIFFVDNIDVAKTYGKYIIKANLIINNPIILDFNENSTYYFYDKWYLQSDLANKIKEISDDIKNGYSIDDELKEYLEELNFNDLYGDLDGIIMLNINDNMDDIFSNHKPVTNYVVFNKNQIKFVK